MRNKIEFFRHNIDAECLKEVEQVIQTLFITTGPRTHEMEKMLADRSWSVSSLLNWVAWW